MQVSVKAASWHTHSMQEKGESPWSNDMCVCPLSYHKSSIDSASICSCQLQCECEFAFTSMQNCNLQASKSDDNTHHLNCKGDKIFLDINDNIKLWDSFDNMNENIDDIQDVSDNEHNSLARPEDFIAEQCKTQNCFEGLSEENNMKCHLLNEEQSGSCKVTPIADHVQDTSAHTGEMMGAQQFSDYFQSLRQWYDTTSRPYFASTQQFANSFTVSGGTVPQLNMQRQRLAYECKTAALWKRLLAEFIDGMLVFLLKFYMIIFLCEGLDLTLDRYVEYWTNPALFLEMVDSTANYYIIAFELTSRIFFFLYETEFLYVLGATPGKRIMGLKVYNVESISRVPGRDTITVWPCSPLGWWRSFMRSMLKSMGLFVFPFCYNLMAINFSRTGYDQITNTLVIDEAESSFSVVTQNVPAPNVP